MQHAEILDKLLIIQSRLIAAQPEKFRPFFNCRDLTSKQRGLLVMGPRGVGKTTFLLREAGKRKVFYLSADHPLVFQTNLYNLAEAAFGQGYEGLIIDEVHYAKDWSLHVKSIYDSYPKNFIWISDSNSVILRKSTGDLARRFPKFSIPFLSFREYLDLKHDIKLDPFDPFNASPKVFENALKQINILECFRNYKKEGFRPIFLEGDYSEKILAIIEKTIFFDVPFFVPQVHENHLRLMNAIMGYLAISPIPTLNIDSLSSEWSVGKEKIYQLLELLEQVGLINIVRYQKDVRVSGKGAKIFFADPSMYQALGGDQGNFREAFVTMIFRQLGRSFHACKDERQGDFIIDKKNILEVGGRNKSLKGAQFVLKDEIDMPGNASIPLWALGMSY